MSNTNIEKISAGSTAELFRLSLAKLGELKLRVTPVNYALIYFYLLGTDLDLNEKFDELLSGPDKFTEEGALHLFNVYICSSNYKENPDLREEVLGTVANILGMLIDLAGKAAISNDSLEEHLTSLAESKNPAEILKIASEIISETRAFIGESRQFETSLSNTTMEMAALKVELNNAKRQAHKDVLTGLNNRRGFVEALLESMKVSQSGDESFCLVLIDIDHFKSINDTYGHLVGDKVLVGLSKVLMKHVRGSDFLCRYGGEEFAIIMSETMITGAFTVAEKLRKSIEKLRLKHAKSKKDIGKITISLGVASYRKGEPENEIIDRCDKALYRAKSLGRNRTIIAD